MSDIRVRMYRHGLGDCFLLTFGGDQAHMLIDCGVLTGTPGATDKMREVAENIRETTGGRLDVLAATHEHWDHISGFLQARDAFAPGSMEIGEIWLTWCEKPGDRRAEQLLKKRRQGIQGLERAVERVRLLGAGSLGLAARLQSVLDFYGGELSLGARATTEEAMNWLRGRQLPVTYRLAGERPIRLREADGVRIFVLGPPEDPEMIAKDRPSRRAPETYHLGFAEAVEAAWLAGAGEIPPAERERIESCLPFDPWLQIASQRAAEAAFFKECYGFTDEAGHGPQWRRIDDDWLEAAGGLALDLDSDTNNTSLVLAIELIESGKVLLFAGDAQVGNWLSWEGLSWQVQDADGDTLTVDAADLLRRTVLYKVGHHGSHNATLREKGLELMTSPELVAMLPVDEARARAKGWGKMPFEPLLERLQEKTAGRILRSDEDLAEEAPPESSRTAWRAFRRQVSDGSGGLYFDYTVSD